MAAARGYKKHRVHVSGLAKTVVHRKDGEQCYEEENAVGDFFYNAGCAVSQVSLLVDNRSNRSRGFAFVEFDDEDSFVKACGLNGTDNPTGIKLDDKACGKLQVSPARPSPDDMHNKQLELTTERNKTEGLEKTLRLIAARINEKMQIIQALRSRQLACQDKASVEEALDEERVRQRAVLSEIEELNRTEASISKELKAEKERTQALEELHAQVHREHLDHGRDTPPGPELELPPPSGLVRDRSAKPHIAPEAEEIHRRIADSPPAPASELERSASWLQKREEKQEELKRAASVGKVTDISRGILDGKMDALERAPSGGQSNRNSTEKANQSRHVEAAPHPRWGDMDDEDNDDDETASLAATSIWGRGGGRQDVQVKNLPPMPVEELKEELLREVSRIWRASSRTEPHLEPIRILEKGVAGEGKAGGEKAYEARLVFKEPYDAWLMVESFGSKEWSSELYPTLHGKMLQVDWPPRVPVPPPDFRGLRHVMRQTDTDASSQISYNTTGMTSSVVQQKSGGAGAAPSAAAAVGPRPEAHGQYVPPQNRTVILSGIPTDLKEYDVRKEILSLLQRLYQRNGFTFDPSLHLHKGEEGVEVRPAMSRKEENGGSVKLRLRNYGDAIWLVEQAQAARLKVADAKLKAAWAQPRGLDKGGGKGEGRSFADVARQSQGKTGYKGAGAGRAGY